MFSDVTSGSRTAIERPGMKRLLDYVESGDAVVVWRIDRLGHSLIDVRRCRPCHQGPAGKQVPGQPTLQQHQQTSPGEFVCQQTRGPGLRILTYNSVAPDAARASSAIMF